jgi:hypothetical protein
MLEWVIIAEYTFVPASLSQVERSEIMFSHNLFIQSEMLFPIRPRLSRKFNIINYRNINIAKSRCWLERPKSWNNFRALVSYQFILFWNCFYCEIHWLLFPKMFPPLNHASEISCTEENITLWLVHINSSFIAHKLSSTPSCLKQFTEKSRVSHHCFLPRS